MAVDMFLKLDGIDGESKDHKHKNEIDVMSFSWGLTQVGASGGGGGGGAGKVQIEDFVVVKDLDQASPRLMEACCRGEHIKTARLALSRKAGGSQQDYFKVTMTDVLVSSYQTGGGNTGGAFPVEQVKFTFGQVTVEAVDAFGKFTEVSCNFVKGENAIFQNHDHEK